MLPDAFRSPRKLAQVSTALLGLVLLLDVANVGSSMMQLDLLERAAREELISPAEAEANDARVQALGLLYMVAYFACAIVFLMWFHRLYKNLSSFVTTPEKNLSSFAFKPLRYTPGWAVGSFFVPFLNLVRPYQIMREAWSHNAPERAAQGSLIGLWWAAWIIAGISGQISFRMTWRAGETIRELVTMTQVQIVDSLLGVPAAILAILVVRQQTEHQIRRARGDAVSDVFG